jgi:hypothetical protein
VFYEGLLDIGEKGVSVADFVTADDTHKVKSVCYLTPKTFGMPFLKIIEKLEWTLLKLLNFSFFE